MLLIAIPTLVVVAGAVVFIVVAAASVVFIVVLRHFD